MIDAGNGIAKPRSPREGSGGSDLAGDGLAEALGGTQEDCSSQVLVHVGQGSPTCLGMILG